MGKASKRPYWIGYQVFKTKILFESQVLPEHLESRIVCCLASEKTQIKWISVVPLTHDSINVLFYSLLNRSPCNWKKKILLFIEVKDYATRSKSSLSSL